MQRKVKIDTDHTEKFEELLSEFHITFKKVWVNKDNPLDERDNSPWNGKNYLTHYIFSMEECSYLFLMYLFNKYTETVDTLRNNWNTQATGYPQDEESWR